METPVISGGIGMPINSMISIPDFYKDMFDGKCPTLVSFLEEQQNQDIGHFNVFDIAKIYENCSGNSMAYNRRTYYKISLIRGRNRVEYADKVIEIGDYAVLFASPKIPYRYTPLDTRRAGHFCVFTADFMAKSKTGLVLNDIPVFGPNSDFVYQINAKQYREIERVFAKMHSEIKSDYAFKYDLLRNYVTELIHTGQKLNPAKTVDNVQNASARISTLFIELLERQFPIESPTQTLELKTAGDFATTLRVHVNHLNKVLKEVTGKTTTEIISSRINQEARILLKQTNWNVSEIANCLGFEEVAHFSNFFKKRTKLSPLSYRN